MISPDISTIQSRVAEAGVEQVSDEQVAQALAFFIENKEKIEAAFIPLFSEYSSGLKNPEISSTIIISIIILALNYFYRENEVRVIELIGGVTAFGLLALFEADPIFFVIPSVCILSAIVPMVIKYFEKEDIDS